MSDEHKAKGNAAFSAKNFPEAIEHFTKGIEVDSKNHVLFSNRSASYTSIGDYQNAFEDAKECVELKPDWAKGYSRLGAALQGLRKYDESIAAFNSGLKVDPNMQALVTGLEAAQKAKSAPPHPLAQLFGPNLYSAIATMPQLKELRDDPEFMGILGRVINDHSLINNYLQDPRMMQLLTSITKQPGGQDDDAPPPQKKPEPKKEPEPVKQYSPEELEAQEVNKKAVAFKAEGNTLYKAKKFPEALELYNKASELEPKNIQFMNNIAAVYLEQKEYEKCIEMCDKATETGKDNNADFKDIGKAMTRKGTCYHKQKDYDNAIVAFKASLLENRSADTLDKVCPPPTHPTFHLGLLLPPFFQQLQKCEAEKKKVAAEAYFSEEKCEEARLAGNEKFKAQQYKEAIYLYDDAIKRNPKAHTVYSNRAAAYMKMGAYDDAEKDCLKAIAIDAGFVKAITRLGHIYFFRKEYHKAMVQYQKGMDLDANNEECKSGHQRTLHKIQVRSHLPNTHPPLCH